MTIIDLSQPLENVSHDKDPSIKYINHQKGGNLLGLLILLNDSFIGIIKNICLYLLGIRKITYQDFANKEGLAWEIIKSDSHASTHLDAPYHFNSKTKGKKSMTIDEVPLHWCISDGVAIDVSNIKGNIISLSDVTNYLDKINYTIKPMDIVLFHTGASKKWNTQEYPSAHKAIPPDVIKYLSNAGVKIIICDSFTIDEPFNVMLEKYLLTKSKDTLWPSHKIGAEIEYLHVENATNIDQLLDSPTGYTISCLPIKIREGSAGWVRLVAIKK